MTVKKDLKQKNDNPDDPDDLSTGPDKNNVEIKASDFIDNNNTFRKKVCSVCI